MAGGLSFILGMVGLFVSAGSRNYVPKEKRDLLSAYDEINSAPPPSEAVKAVYEKWKFKRQNGRGEWIYKVEGAHSSYHSAKLWWKHIYEDEGVEVSDKYLNKISGYVNELFRKEVNRLSR